MKEISCLLQESLKWCPIPERGREFASNVYAQEDCFLRINDFPDEPLWTLFYKGESIDFDNTSKKWEISYEK